MLLALKNLRKQTVSQCVSQSPFGRRPDECAQADLFRGPANQSRKASARGGKQVGKVALSALRI